jgi:hypothetical protein
MGKHHKSNQTHGDVPIRLDFLLGEMHAGPTSAITGVGLEKRFSNYMKKKEFEMFISCMKKWQLSFLVALLLVLAPTGPSYAVAEDQLGTPVATPIGTFGGIAYIQYDGIFEGQTSTGTYRVPYRITAPADPARGNRTVLVEPPHFAIGLGALDAYLGRDFLLSRGFTHAGVGWSTALDETRLTLRILDPTVPNVFINGGFAEYDGRTDDEIIVDFARALVSDSNAQAMLGSISRRYITGFSDSSDPVMRLITSGQAAGVFDFALPFTTFPETDPQEAIMAGVYAGKLIILNSELEWPATYLVDRGHSPSQYRFYAVAGTPHIPDPLSPFFSNMTTPASYQPELRAHFLQGDNWVKRGTPPPASTHFRTSDGVTLDRDANGNAITVGGKGKSLPRLPFIELGEARFFGEDFIGSYDNVKTITELGFKNHDQYLKAFEIKLKDYVKAGYMLDEDADVMLLRAALCPSLTFTEVYRDAYQNFVNIEPCQ